MSRRLEDNVREWLRAEGTGPDELAEEALARALADLGRRRPGAGFADRALMRAGRLSPAWFAWRSWWSRAAVAGCLLVAGLAVASLPTWLLIAGPLARALGAPFTAVVWHWMTEWAVAAFASWGVIADVTTAVCVWLATPSGIALLAVNVLLACGSLIGLKRLLKAPEELISW